MFLGFGIMSFRFAALLWSTTTFPSPVILHFALLFCNCQSYGSFSGRIIETHICSRCNLACALSDEYLEEKLIIIVGGVDQREKCRGASVLNPNFGHTASFFLLLLHPFLPLTHCYFAAKSCPCRPRPFWKGLAYSMWGVFFLRRVLAVHGNQIHRGHGIHTVMVVIAMGKTFYSGFSALWKASPSLTSVLSHNLHPYTAHSRNVSGFKMGQDIFK